MSKILRILAILGTITGGIANLGVVPLVPATLSVFIIALSLALHQVIDVIGDFLDNGKTDWRGASLWVIGALIIGGLSLASLTACSNSGSSSSPGTTSGASSTGTVTSTGTTTSSASADIEAALPLVRTGAAVATGAVLDFAIQQSSTRSRLANEMYEAASDVYQMTGTGNFPTPAQFSATILAYGGSQSDASYAQFSAAIGALYAAYYPKLDTGDTKTATDLLNAIAGGIEDATASYVSTPATTDTGTLTL